MACNTFSALALLSLIEFSIKDKMIHCIYGDYQY